MQVKYSAVNSSSYRNSPINLHSPAFDQTFLWPVAMQTACSTSAHAANAPTWRQCCASLHVRPRHGRAGLARHWPSTTQRQDMRVTAAEGMSDGWRPEEDPYFKLMSSKVMQNEVVRREHDVVVNEMQMLSMMARKFPDFDVAGKRMFLDKLDEMTEKYQIFIKRLELSDDPAAKEYLRHTNAQMLEGGFSLHIMLQGLTQSAGAFREMMEEEERCSSDPIRLAAFKQHMRSQWAQSSLGRFDFAKLAQNADPLKVIRAQQHPEFFKALKEISNNPTPEVLSRWLGHEEIGPFVADLWKSMQGQGGPASFGGL